MKKFLAFSLGPIVGAAISFLTVPLLTFFIPPEEYGKISMYSLFQSMFVVLAFLGMDQSFIREFHKYADRKKLIFNALFIPLVMSLLFIMLFPFFGAEFSKILFDGNYPIVFALLAIALPLMIVEKFLLLNLRMEEKALQYSFFNILFKVIILVATIAALYLFGPNYINIIYANIISQIATDVVFIILYIHTMPNMLAFKKYFDKKLLVKMLRFGLPLAPALIIGWVMNSTDRLMLRYFSTYDQIGIYSIAMSISAIITILQVSFSTYWTPVSYRWFNEDKKISEFEKISRIITILLTIVFIMILLFKDVIMLIMASDYNNAKYVFPFLIVYPIVYTISETTSMGISFMRKSKYHLYISIVVGIINILLNYLLVPTLGALGAAMATGLSYVLFFIIRTVVSGKVWKKQTVNYGYIVIILLLAIVNSFIYNDIIVNAFNIVVIILIFVFEKKFIFKFLKESRNL